MAELQQRVLEILAEEGAVSPADICRIGGLAQNGIYVTIDRLVKKGLVRKLERDGSNRYCMLTDEGEVRAAELAREDERIAEMLLEREQL